MHSMVRSRSRCDARLDRVARRQAVLARLVQARPRDRQRRRDEHAVLVRLQQVRRLLVGVRRVIDHVDAVAHAHLAPTRRCAHARRRALPLLVARPRTRRRPRRRSSACCAEGIAGVDVSPDGTIFSTSTPSRQASRAARRNSTGPSQGSVYIASPGSRWSWRRSPTPPVTVNCTLAAQQPRARELARPSIALRMTTSSRGLVAAALNARREALVEIELRVLQRAAAGALRPAAWKTHAASPGRRSSGARAARSVPASASRRRSRRHSRPAAPVADLPGSPRRSYCRRRRRRRRRAWLRSRRALAR